MNKIILSLKLFAIACFALCMFSSCDDKAEGVVIYTVTFDTGDGAQIESVKVNAGEAVEKPADPTIDTEYYVFDQWYSDAEFAAPYDFSKPVESDITIYAAFVELPKFTVEYYYIDNTSAAVSLACDEDYHQGEAHTAAPESIEATVLAAEYTYVNEWYTDEALSDVYSFDAEISEDLKLYTKVKATVHFDTNGGFVEPAMVDQVVDLNTYLTQDPVNNGNGYNIWHAQSHLFFQYNWTIGAPGYEYSKSFDDYLITKNSTMYMSWAGGY